ncbi:hypothetical protein ABZ370_35165 [Streptomyces sp. NPDC005962]|uniref:hypothetical protein n=1 Tax=Streptomyces sp. NPDC005962 TaxID=3154466 RepID=UPI00340E23F0
MRVHENVGRVYRRCGCRDEQRRQLGAHCLQLMSDPAHGTWTFAVDLPATEPGGHNLWGSVIHRCWSKRYGTARGAATMFGDRVAFVPDDSTSPRRPGRASMAGHLEGG